MKYNTLAVALGLSVTQVAAQKINKDALWGNLDWTHNVLRSLPSKNYNVRYWSLNDISQTCYDTAKREGVDPRAMRQHSVTYGDCDQEWYVCVEDGLSADDVAREFSRIPVRMRQWVGDVVAFKKGGGAWAWVNQITLFGGAATTPVMLHEATHCVDLNDGFYSMQSGWQGMGDPKEWVDTINRDSAVPDDYAKNNPTENLAQFPALIIYDRVTGRLGQEQPQLPRIGHQLQKVADQSDWSSAWGGGILDYSGNLRCTRRWEHPRAVWPDSGKPVYTRRTVNGTFEGSPESKPNVPADKATIYIAPEPLELKAKFAPTNCSSIH